MSRRGELRIGPDTASLAAVRALIADTVRGSGFPERHLPRLLIAVDEAVTNIIEHGYGDVAAAGDIAIACEADERRCAITIVDAGHAYDPRQGDDVDIVRHCAQGRSGGLGVFLIRRIMDVIDYHHEAGKGNRLVMVKHA